MATPIKDSTWIYDHARRMHFSRNDAFGLNLHAAARKNHAVEVT